MSHGKQFDRLRIALPPGEDWSTINWLSWSKWRPVLQGASELDKLPNAEFVELIVPWQRVSMHLLTLPAQPGRHLDALISQALEDRLLGDKTDALAVSGPQTGTERQVWVTSRRWIEAALERLSSAGIEPACLLPEFALLPESPDAVTCAVTPTGTFFRTADNRFGLVRDDATLDALIGGTARDQVPDLYGLPWPNGWPVTLPRSLARFARRGFDPQCWFPALKWTALCASVFLLGQVIYWRQLENRETRLQHEIRQTFATTFPGTPVIDPVLQWESKRREAGQSRRDALDAALGLAARINAPVRPRQIEAGEGFVRLTLSENDVAQFRTPLESVGKPEISPSELGVGLLRLHYRSAP